MPSPARRTLGAGVALLISALVLFASSATASATPGVGGVQGTPATTPSSAGATPHILDASGTPLAGTGSSFAAPAVSTWINDVQSAPYNLSMNYTTSSSGQGRYEFTNQTTDFAVSDIGYVGNTDTTPPSFPFNFIPITAGGIAFMYDVPNVSKAIQLTSYTACALLTGGIKTWNDPALTVDNPGANLPNIPVIPVTESDSAGTNYVLEEWCIDEQPALWAAFVHQQESQSGGPTDGVAIAATSPNSNWPGIEGGLDDQNTTAVAGDIATNAGAIGAVQVNYAESESGFSGSNPAKSVALVQNASGDYTAPTAPDVASALAYATQQANGTHKLDFGGVGPHVYNPSTYSYLLTPTTGWSKTKGATMSAFVNYALTLGQSKVPSIGYATLGLSLEQYGINAVTVNVPGSVAPTAAEKAAYSCGDLTPAEVMAGQTTPTCGVTNQTAAPPPPNGGTAVGATTSLSSGSSGGSTGTGGTSAAAKTVSTTHPGTASSGGAAGSISPFVSLSGPSGLPNTGDNPLPLTLLGALLLVVGALGRRLVRRRARSA